MALLANDGTEMINSDSPGGVQSRRSPMSAPKALCRRATVRSTGRSPPTACSRLPIRASAPGSTRAPAPPFRTSRGTSSIRPACSAKAGRDPVRPDREHRPASGRVHWHHKWGHDADPARRTRRRSPRPIPCGSNCCRPCRAEAVKAAAARRPNDAAQPQLRSARIEPRWGGWGNTCDHVWTWAARSARMPRISNLRRKKAKFREGRSGVFPRAEAPERCGGALDDRGSGAPHLLVSCGRS